MDHTWQQLLKFYDDGQITMAELKMSLFESFATPEKAELFLDGAPDEYKIMLAKVNDGCPADDDDVNWEKIKVFAFNMTIEECKQVAVRIRTGVKNYRIASRR